MTWRRALLALSLKMVSAPMLTWLCACLLVLVVLLGLPLALDTLVALAS